MWTPKKLSSAVQALQKTQPLLLVGYYILIFITLVFTGFNLITIETGRWMLALLFILAMAQRQFWLMVPQDRFETYFYVFCGFALLTAPWGLHPFNTLLHVAALMAVWRLVVANFPKTLSRQAKLWQWLTLICVAYALFNAVMFLINPSLIYRPLIQHSFHAIGASSNLTGLLFLTGIIFGLLWQYSTDQPRQRYYAVACNILLCIFIVPTFSRNAIFSLEILFGILLLHCLFSRSIKAFVARHKILILIPLIGVALPILSIAIPELRGHVLIKSYDFYLMNIPNGRVHLWSRLLKLIWEHQTWWIGIGFGNQTDYVHMAVKWLDTAHNIYLETFLHTGIAGTLVFLTALYYMLKTSWQNYKHNKHLLTLTVFSTQIVLLIQACFESSLLQQFSSQLFLLALLHRWNQCQAEQLTLRSPQIDTALEPASQ